ncbi:MAG: 7TM diverse intracellular signaling domain-containing protein [Bacteroidota bacterium]
MSRYHTKIILLLVIFALCGGNYTHAQTSPSSSPVVTDISMLEDKSGSLDAAAVMKSGEFKHVDVATPNYGLTESVYWFKVNVANHSQENDLLLKIHNGIVTKASFYEPSGNSFRVWHSGDSVPFVHKAYNSQFPIFRLHLPRDSSASYLLRVSSNNVLDLPMKVSSEVQILDAVNKDQWFFGIYFGIILVMFFYNLFIYVTVRDTNYLYYVFYIATVGLVQACLKGYAAKFFWRNNTWLTINMPNIALSLSGIFAIFFVFNFLNVKQYFKKLYYILWAINIIYFIGIAISLTGNHIVAQKMLQGNASLVSIAIMTAGIMIYRRGFKPALYFTVAWSFFLTGVVIYILKDAGVLPYNGFTSNAILIGSGFEVSLLSFALADKINIYRKEKEASQAQALLALQENERIVLGQNVMLERKVDERTYELKVSNDELNKAMVELKEAETQLVESEKMASLGQLTAGIAHEINNPINFVTSNVKPLNRDVQILLDTVEVMERMVTDDSIPVPEKLKKIQEYKEEIDYDYLKVEIDQLLSGIGEGASRTAEIVKGLRIFSRLDEDDLKKADINEGLESTLIITNNLLNNLIKIEKRYGSLPMVECYPGKLNQVFLNIISNGIYAVKKKFGESDGGLLTITTYHDENNVFINIADNGTGMDDGTKKRLFEPFFTTKDVGEGTGLGLSIAFNTINKHDGRIEVISELGKGTEFIIRLPLIHK